MNYETPFYSFSDRKRCLRWLFAEGMGALDIVCSVGIMLPLLSSSPHPVDNGPGLRGGGEGGSNRSAQPHHMILSNCPL